MLCASCNLPIPNTMLIDGKMRRTQRSRKKCYICSPFIPNKTKPIQPATSDAKVADNERRCRICGRIFKIKKDSQGRTRGKYSHKCWSCTVSHRRFALRERARNLLGGKCEICGYNKCSQALVFHHKNPEEKKFEISSGWSRKWETIKEEVLKCKLLCCRCHTELHYELNQAQIHYRNKG
jgi:hypothetical protein